MNTTHSAATSSTESTIINPFKNYNYELGDGRFGSNPGTLPIAITSTTTANIKRYSRTELYDFRNNTTSRSRPEPSLRAELQSLGVWKFNSSSCHQNGNNITSAISSGEGTPSASSGHSSASAISLSTSHLSGRSQRSPSTRDHSTTTATSTSSTNHNVIHHSIQKSYIDHRSISSSHLMPAFAKRRIAATSAAATTAASQNLPSNSSSTYGGNSPIDARSQSPTDKDGLLYISSNMRQRTKEHLYEYRQRGGNGGGEEHSSYLSPQRKIVVDHDRERDRDRESDHSIGRRLSSPVIGNTRNSHLGSGSAHERRIGSGRLLPRDVNWDYRAGHDKEKSQSINSVSAAEKDTVSSHVLQSRNSGRFSERLHERSGGGNISSNVSYIERRPFDRRTCGSEDNLRDKYDHISNSTSGSAHGSGRREVYTSESSSNHQPTSHSRNRRNHQYNDRSEEPEWFSGGPTSQHDTIELRGFEEIDEHYANNNTNGSGITKRSTLATSGRKLSESSSSRASSTLNLSNSKSKEQLLGLKEHEKDIDSNINVSPVALNVINDFVADVELCNESRKIAPQKNVNGDSNNNNNNNNSYTELLSRENEKHISDSTLQNSIQDKREIRKTSIKIPTKEAEFNFDAFLNPNLDPLKHSLMRGDSLIGNDNENIGSSRFSRWFVSKATTNDAKSTVAGNSSDSASGSNATESTTNKDNAELQNKTITLMEFLQLSKLPTIGDTGLPQKALMPSVEELEARMRNMDAGNESSNDSISISSTVLKSIDPERPLEPDTQAGNQSPLTQPQAREIEAFKKLLEQLGSGNKQQQQQPQHHNSQAQQPHIAPANMQMNILLQQQQNHTGPMPPMNILIAPHLPQPIPPQVLLKNDEIKKIMQHQMLNQQQQHTKQLQTVLPPSHSINQHLPPMSPNVSQSNNDPNNVPSPQSQGVNLSVLFVSHPQKRMEAQHLFQCLTRGEVSRSMLEQELSNPNTSPHARDVIVAVLRESARSVTPSTNLNVNVPPPQSLGNAGVVTLQHQQLSSPIPIGSGSNISNGPPQTQGPLNAAGAVPQQQLLQQMPNPNVILPGQPDQRIPLLQTLPNHHQGLPSQRELQFHTQTIMQNALFKKKIEEQQQQESLRRRQEMQKQQPNIMISGLNEIDIQQKNLQQHLQQPPQLTSQQQTHVSHNMQQQQPQHLNSPTPLAFTPTSVLRKMTAEKENSTVSASHPQQNTSIQQQQNKQLGPSVYINTQSTQQMLQQQPPISTQPRMILGGNHTQHQQQQVNNGTQITGISQQQQSIQQMRSTILPMKWPVHFMNQNMNINKPMGRPILKGPLPTAQSTNQQQLPPQQSIPTMPQQLSQIAFASKFDFQQMQQQQRLKNNQTPQHMMNQSAQPFPPHSLSQQQPPQQSPQTQAHNLIPQPQQQLFQQHQQRSIALQRQHQQIQMQQQQQTLDAANRNIGMQPPSSVSDSSVVSNNNPAVVAAAAAVGIMNYQRDGGLSPTSNQLAQWFSPELLAQASAGKLPLLNMNQALSLEEFERSIQHSSAAVHN